MERVTGIGGVFLRAHDPGALAENGRFTWADEPESNRFGLYQPPAGS